MIESYVCKTCKYETSRKNDYIKHMSTIKHLKKCKKTIEPSKYYCNPCEFLTYRKYDYNRHLLSPKHLSNVNHVYTCDKCMKEYKYKKLYDQHVKTCVSQLEIMVPTITINNNININVYLNNEYGNAINIAEFRNQLTLTQEDLLYTKNNGYAKGISNIFIKKMEELGPCQRPIHCKKSREPQFYVRDDNNWVEDIEHNELNMAIDSVANAQIGKIKEWEKYNPNWCETNEGQKEYLDIVKSVINGSTQLEQEKNNKLIKRSIRESLEIDVPSKLNLELKL